MLRRNLFNLSDKIDCDNLIKLRRHFVNFCSLKIKKYIDKYC